MIGNALFDAVGQKDVKNSAEAIVRSADVNVIAKDEVRIWDAFDVINRKICSRASMFV